MGRFAMAALIVFFTTFVLFSAQPVRYKDKIFSKATVLPNVKYGSAVATSGIGESLLLDLYAPDGDDLKERPLIVWVHGGSFAFGSKEDADVQFLCSEFAKRGYVTATINYRLNPQILFSMTKPSFSKAIVQAVQDAKASVRFLRAHKTDYGIDDSRIALGGTSAGGVTALHYAYCGPAEIASIVDTATVGGVEGNSGTPGVSSSINAIVNCWGAIGDTAWLTGETMPVISFHGTKDPIVPYDAGFAFGNPQLPLFGSSAVNRVALRNGMTSVFKSFPGMGHGVPSFSDPRGDTIVVMTADFLYSQFFTSGVIILPVARTTALPNTQTNAYTVLLPHLSTTHTFHATFKEKFVALNGRSIAMPLSGSIGQPVIGAAETVLEKQR